MGLRALPGPRGSAVVIGSSSLLPKGSTCRAWGGGTEQGTPRTPGAFTSSLGVPLAGLTSQACGLRLF